MWCSWLVGVMAPESTASRSASVRANGSGISGSPAADADRRWWVSFPGASGGSGPRTWATTGTRRTLRGRGSSRVYRRRRRKSPLIGARCCTVLRPRVMSSSLSVKAVACKRARTGTPRSPIPSTSPVTNHSQPRSRRCSKAGIAPRRSAASAADRRRPLGVKPVSIFSGCRRAHRRRSRAASTACASSDRRRVLPPWRGRAPPVATPSALSARRITSTPTVGPLRPSASSSSPARRNVDERIFDAASCRTSRGRPGASPPPGRRTRRRTPPRLGVEVQRHGHQEAREPVCEGVELVLVAVRRRPGAVVSP